MGRTDNRPPDEFQIRHSCGNFELDWTWARTRALVMSSSRRADWTQEKGLRHQQRQGRWRPYLSRGRAGMIPTQLDAELVSLESMSRAELRAAWSRQVRTTPPKLSTGLLRLALAHHLQSKAF